MDCNREEALRAKHMAEKKMENKDFSGALKIAVKAQQLYPDLENISQMILVCEVYCSAEKKFYGTDKDWYGILKVEPSADDLSIKKQYRKLALALHPDKNKFSGSTDAFKLVGEAQKVLLDREKRMIHDSKRRAFGNISAPNWIPKQPSRQSNVVQCPWNKSSFPQDHYAYSQFQNNFTTGRSGNYQFSQQQAQTGISGERSTFWTVCPFCSVRYQFYRDDVLNKVIHCQGCKKSFTAYEMNAQGSSQNHQPPSFSQQNRVPSTDFTSKPVSRGVHSKPFSGGVNSHRKEPRKTQGNVNRKRKKVVESSESSDSDSSSESDEDVEEHIESSYNKNGAGLDFQNFGEQPRRSSRPKRNVSYKDTFWKEEVTKVVEDHKKRFQTQEDDKESQCKHTSDDKWGERVDANAEETEPEVLECPDPQFYDFEKDKKEECFIAGQTWAVYDTEDAMPRFYAYIRKVESPGFHLLITWLKPMPENEDEEKWLKAELPASCGKFKREKHDRATDLPMFSHMVLEAFPQKGIFTIVPRKGETWALFRDWSINWHSDTRSFKYEFVEILSDYDEDVGVGVSYLEKVKGFVCLYKRREGEETLIPARDKYRLSHMVPSCRMSGEEREGVPTGSFELDPAGMPSSVFEQVIS